jgi:aminopeptidase N
MLALWMVCIHAHGQQFTRQDTLRGSITEERAWWDLKHYDLNIKVDPDARTLTGFNVVTYEVLDEHAVMQIDLQDPMVLTRAEQEGVSLELNKDGYAYFINLKKEQKRGSTQSITLFFEGSPKVSRRPPWDGGLTWEKDENGNHFIATSCQGEGASLWWPCKDHMYDEPEGMDMRITVPDPLMDVSNGRLISVAKNDDNTSTYHWKVVNPINNYGVNINIANYVKFSEIYAGEKGDLDCDYYVLPEHLEKAKVHFKDTRLMLEAFEHWFGPYPFYEDGFKLVEVPYLGMEHQSSVTYGNQYKKGYLGRDLSGTGWGLKFDFIIIHEAGHEWFANNITYKDMADMWIHESFTAYSESLFLDYHYGTEAANAYMIGVRKNIRNNRPIIGPYNVNRSGSGDMYPKGANMLHTLRQLVEDDDLWRELLRGLNEEFYHSTVTTEEIENYMSKITGKDLTEFFNQYLRDNRIPRMEHRREGNQLFFRYTDIVDKFDMPVRVYIDGKETWLFPDKNWQQKTLPSAASEFRHDPNFYIVVEEIKPD